MAEAKTKPTDQSVEDFLNAIPDEKKRKDSIAIVEMMRRVSGSQPVMWGDAIVGFGLQQIVYAGGKTGDWPKIGFSPRKQNLTLYGMGGLSRHPGLAARLGKYKTGNTCLYINKLADVDFGVLEEVTGLVFRGE